jgi:release factor glutamine methyltransferase
LNILRIIAPIINKLARIYTSKEREFSFKDIKVKVTPGVFHPGLFISSKILLNFVDKLNLGDKTFLELGAGSGIISILSAKRGAKAYASDISGIAIENIKMNARKNNISINVIHSDLFQNIPNIQFNYIIINPPYYKKDPKTDEEYAWYCGSNHEYFIRLFDSIAGYINQDSKIFMILSEVCDIDAIRTIGKKKGFNWKLIERKTVWGERNYIYNLVKI